MHRQVEFRARSSGRRKRSRRRRRRLEVKIATGYCDGDDRGKASLIHDMSFGMMDDVDDGTSSNGDQASPCFNWGRGRLGLGNTRLANRAKNMTTLGLPHRGRVVFHARYCLDLLLVI